MGDHAPDRIGLVALPGIGQFVPHHHLTLVIGRGRVGLGDIKRDLAFFERREDRIGEIGQAQTAFDEPAGAAETLGDRVEVAALVDEVLVGADLVGRRHVEADDVLDQRKFGLLGAVGVDDLARHLVGLGHLARLKQRIERAQTPTTGGHIEEPASFGGHHDQVLQEALGLDIGGKLLDEEVAIVLADIGFGQAQLAERDHLDIVHGRAPHGRNGSSRTAQPLQPPSPFDTSGTDWTHGSQQRGCLWRSWNVIVVCA